MNKKVAIVILNYMNYEDTIACINCALNQSYYNIRIIVVDNGSSNQSYSILKFIYAHCKKVKILRSSKNLGFAKGNNVGIQYARTQFRADYVFVCNNDVVFEDTLIEEMISKEYPGVGAISPTVYQLGSSLQPETVVAGEVSTFIKSAIYHICLEWLRLLPIVSYLDGKRKERNPKSVKVSQKEGRRYMLQGCAFLLTPEFFQYYKQLYPKTFLYWEDINLLAYLEKVGLGANIIETTPCIHKTNQLLQTKKKQRKTLFYKTISMLWSLPMHLKKYPKVVKYYEEG